VRFQFAVARIAPASLFNEFLAWRSLAFVCSTTSRRGSGGRPNRGRTYLGIERSDDLVMIQLSVSNTRTVEKKQALFRQIAANLTAPPDFARRTS
jgi:hypothetical protein